MTTDKQRRANIENAKKSTGPRTDAGLQKSKLNGLRHGLCAQQAILPDENKEIFEELRSSMYAEYSPTSAAQIFCVEKMLLSIWRSRRCAKLDAIAHADLGIDELNQISRYESTLERAFYRAHKLLTELKKSENGFAPQNEKVDTTPAVQPPPTTPEIVAAEPPPKRYRMMPGGKLELITDEISETVAKSA